MPETEPKFRVYRQELFSDGESATAITRSGLSHTEAIELAYRLNLEHAGKVVRMTCPIDHKPVDYTIAYFYDAEPEPEPLPMTGPN